MHVLLSYFPLPGPLASRPVSGKQLRCNHEMRCDKQVYETSLAGERDMKTPVVRVIFTSRSAPDSEEHSTSSVPVW